MTKKYDPHATYYSLYIHNADTLQIINELALKLGNRNAVLNYALDIGAPILSARFAGREVKPTKEQNSQNQAVAREIKELRKIVNDVFAEMCVQETMMAGMYNALVAYADGEDIDARALRDGSLCDLPELVAGIKGDLTRKRKN